MSLPQFASAPPAIAMSTALLVDARDGRQGADRIAERDSEAAHDAALMARIVAGDQAAFHRFAQRHVARFLAVAQRIIGNESDAEEVVQDALLRVWLHAPEWQSGGSRVTSWVYRIVVNLALDCLRRHRGRLLSLDDAGDPADPAPDAEMLAESRQLESFIARAIAELPTRQRIALTLCCFEQMECAEAAQIMQISLSAMESLLVRGRRTLRERLQRLGQADRWSAPWACRRDGQSTPTPIGRFAAA
ncbi:MAG TPA: sigma-70 family RNA polymerase sigma factor [Stellaceae bacterium]|jgi:RNA polymerase sigma-70 factor (ECF subfamily)|nr:sigma-70 family RNA polymerase sigma factor [Stellaceae bacterium]